MLEADQPDAISEVYLRTVGGRKFAQPLNYLPALNLISQKRNPTLSTMFAKAQAQGV